MALLIRNQAAFVEQIARNDQERLRLQRQSDERQIENNERFARIEQRLTRIEADLLKLPKTIVQTILDDETNRETGSACDRHDLHGR